MIQHLGIIMDGNRRWAKERGLATLQGHKKGYDVMKEIGDYALSNGIKYLTVFAFSTENWKRSAEEVSYLMDLLLMAVTRDLKEIHEKNIRLKIIGRREQLSKNLQKAIAKAEELTKDNTKGTLQVAINYGGRPEIVDAVNELIKENHGPVTEEDLEKHLYTAGAPDPEMIVRTSGEQRVSGFLTWQGVYSELLFLEKYWPDFTTNDIDEIVKIYDNRNRRFGGN